MCLRDGVSQRLAGVDVIFARRQRLIGCQRSCDLRCCVRGGFGPVYYPRSRGLEWECASQFDQGDGVVRRQLPGSFALTLITPGPVQNHRRTASQ